MIACTPWRHRRYVTQQHPTTQPSTQKNKTHTQLTQDYSEEFRDIGGVKGKGKAQLPEGAITLINQRIVTDDLPVISTTPYEKQTWSNLPLNLIRVTSLQHFLLITKP